jgi:hypothetical protein
METESGGLAHVLNSLNALFFGRLRCEPSLFGGFLGCFGTRATANGLMAVLEDFRLVSVSPELQPFQPGPIDAACISLGTHDNRVPAYTPITWSGSRQSPHRCPPIHRLPHTRRTPRRVNLYCIQNPHSSRTVKSTMTAISAILAIVFMASPYIARRRLKKKPRTGGERGF